VSTGTGGLLVGFILYRRCDAVLTVSTLLCKYQSPTECRLASIAYHRAEYFVSHTEVAEELEPTEQNVVPEPSCGRATA
jgi:hypothetical protein